MIREGQTCPNRHFSAKSPFLLENARFRPLYGAILHTYAAISRLYAAILHPYLTVLPLYAGVLRVYASILRLAPESLLMYMIILALYVTTFPLHVRILALHVRFTEIPEKLRLRVIQSNAVCHAAPKPTLQASAVRPRAGEQSFI
jgi:hypothetical protein